jgi:prophage regulatory protein
MYQLLRLSDVVRVTRLSRSTLWRLERAGRFPPRRQLSARAVAWSEQEVNDWIRSRALIGGSTEKGGTRHAN